MSLNTTKTVDVTEEVKPSSPDINGFIISLIAFIMTQTDNLKDAWMLTSPLRIFKHVQNGLQSLYREQDLNDEDYNGDYDDDENIVPDDHKNFDEREQEYNRKFAQLFKTFNLTQEQRDSFVENYVNAFPLPLDCRCCFNSPCGGNCRCCTNVADTVYLDDDGTVNVALLSTDISRSDIEIDEEKKTILFPSLHCYESGDNSDDCTIEYSSKMSLEEYIVKFHEDLRIKLLSC